MELVIVAAIAANGVIGKEGGLPWHIPAEEKQYHDIIRGGWAVVGRKSIETEKNSLPLEGLMIITRNQDFTSRTNIVVHSIDGAIAKAEAKGLEKLFILGGSEIYRQTLSRADRMIISKIDAEVEGDIYFPDFDLANWQVIASRKYPKDNENLYGFEVVEMVRIESREFLTNIYK